MTKAFLHVGLPKTGTSFLQVEVFPQLPVYFIHKRIGPKNQKFIDFLHDFFHNPTRLDDTRKSNHLYFLRNAIDKSNGQNLLISDENISVTIAGLWREGDTNAKRFSENLKKYIDFCNSSGLEFEILFTIRRQDNWIASRYAESAKLFQNFSDQHFGRLINSNFLSEIAQYSLINYYLLLDALRQQCPQSPIHFFVYEEFDQAPQLFLHKLAGLLTDWQFKNNDLPSIRKNVGRENDDTWKMKSIPQKTIRLDDKRRQCILDLFKKSNALFSENQNLNLEYYGYY